MSHRAHLFLVRVNTEQTWILFLERLKSHDTFTGSIVAPALRTVGGMHVLLGRAVSKFASVVLIRWVITGVSSSLDVL